MDVQVAQTLCRRCDSLDLDKIFAGNYETPQIVAKLGAVPQDMLSSECPLCRLLAEAVHRPFSDESLTSYHDTCDLLCNHARADDPFVHGYFLFADRVNSSRWEGIGHSDYAHYLGFILNGAMHNEGMFLKSDFSNANVATATANDLCPPTTADMDIPDEGFIALKTGRLKDGTSGIASYLGSIYPVSSPESKAGAGRLVPPVIDWTLLRSFVRTCQDSHEACRSDTEETSIVGFCLINCSTRSLEPATPEASYVALSYVWGQPDKSNDFQALLEPSDGLPSMPLVIEDAMAAVREMGLVYLWVDRYCIKQDDCEILSDHLSKMHVIYRQAHFTIIAAAGSDSAFGLPGVSTRRRQTQAHANVGGRLLASALEPFAHSSKSIKWNTRAWTYQEGVFSVRQLIFDTHEVTFVCAESQKCESLAHPSDVNKSSQRLFGVRNCSAWEHISHYSKRDLTFESDALNAITATLNDYKDKANDAAFHTWGMPFAANLNALDGSSPGPLSHTTFASEDAIFGFSLAWYSTSPDLRRRHGFPTWSWPSCRANVGFLDVPDRNSNNVLMPDPEIDVRLEYCDGQILSLSEYMSRNPSLELSRYLHLEAWSVRSSLTFHPGEGRVTIDVGDCKYHLTGKIGLETLPDDKDQKPIHDLMMAKDGWEAIVVFYSPEDYECAVQPFIITLMRVDDPEKPNEEVYERIGHIKGLRLEKMPKRREENHQAPEEDVSDRTDSPSKNVSNLRRTVGWAAKALDDQARDTQEAEEKFRKFRESLQQVGHIPQPSAVTTAESDVSVGSHLSREPDTEGEARLSSSQIFSSEVGFEELSRKAGRLETSALGTTSTPSTLEDMGTASKALDPVTTTSGQEVEFETPQNEETDGLDGGGHSTDSVSSSEADSDDHGDYTINLVVRRGHIKRLFPRIPMLRKSLVIR